MHAIAIISNAGFTLHVRAENAAGAHERSWQVEVLPALADVDRDGDVNQHDFGRFQACFTEPTVPVTDPDCADADLDRDGGLNRNDCRILEGCLSGANAPANMTCAD